MIRKPDLPIWSYSREKHKTYGKTPVSDYKECRNYCSTAVSIFDTDVEVNHPLEQYLKVHSMVIGFESEQTLTTAFIECCEDHYLMSDMKESIIKDIS